MSPSAARAAGARPGPRAGRAHQRQVVGDLAQRDRHDLQRARRARPGRRGCPAPRSGRPARNVEAGVGAELLAHLRRELGMRCSVRFRSRCRRAGSARPGQGRRAPGPRPAAPARVAAELLAEGHRDRVHQVGAAGLDDVVELLGLALQGAPSASSAGSSSEWTSPSAARWTAEGKTSLEDCPC